MEIPLPLIQSSSQAVVKARARKGSGMAHMDFTVAPYTTGDLVDGSISYRLSFVNQQWMLLAVMAALTTLTIADNWNTVGEFSPVEAADLAIRMIEDFNPMVDQVGFIVPYAGSVAPDGALLCDGASYLRTDYAALFAIIGTAFGATDSTHFSVPDLRGRTAVGNGSGPGLTPRSIGVALGEETHTLTVSELAAHTHTDLGHVHAESVAAPSAIAIGPGVPAPSAIPAIGSTGSGFSNLANAGGDTGHNNIQPTLVTGYIILTR